MKRLLKLFSILFLAVACAAPRTNAPRLSNAEIQNERQIKRQLASEQNQASNTQMVMSNNEMLERLRRIGGEVQNSAIPMCRELGGRKCEFSFVITLPKPGQSEPPINAFADGTRIYVTRAMLHFAQSDDELALVLAHEYAHNMMGHIASQQQNAMIGSVAGTLVDALASSQGINTGGGFSKFGGQAAAIKYSRDFEKEADYVGMYVMARMNRNYHSAPEMWRILSIREPQAIYVSTTHPSNPERFVGMEKFAREIDYKKQSGQPLLPNFKQK